MKRRPHVVIITESWLDDTKNISLCESNMNLLENMKYKPVPCHRKNVTSPCGGILALVDSDLSIIPVSNTSSNQCEILMFDLFVNDNPTRICSVYRSPSSPIEGTLLLTKNIREHLTGKQFVMCGDFNFPSINWKTYEVSNDNNARKFLNAILDINAHQLVNFSTRLNNTLDLVFTNNESIIYGVEKLAPFYTSDHCAIGFNISCPKNNSDETNIVKLLDFKNVNAAEMHDYLNKINWQHCFSNCQSVDDMYSIFLDILYDCYFQFVPLKVNKAANNGLPWFNRSLSSLIRRRDQTWDKYCKSNRSNDLKIFYKLSRKCKALNDSLRRNYESLLILNGRLQDFYKYANKRLSSRPSIPGLRAQDGGIASSDSSKCDLLNDFFVSVFTVDNGEAVPQTASLPPKSINDVAFSPLVIECLLRKTKINSAMGPDLVHPSILNHFSDCFSLPLSMIFTRSFETGEIPSVWKMANVVPIFKNNGCPTLVENYRPISLTPIPCKLMESVIRLQIMRFLIDNNIISPAQFGFLPNKSTEMQLLESINDWAHSLDKANHVDVIYFDLKKAFDTVSHAKLIEKLESYNIKGRLLRWIIAFLSDRQQRVVIKNSSSNWKRVTSGVPQGSVLGPLLFLLFINDLPLYIKHCVIKMYADDVKIYMKNGADQLLVQNDINTIVNFFSDHQLSINIKKCVVLRLGASNPELPYYVNGAKIDSVNEISDLGVIVDRNLTFSQHCSHISAKARRICGLIIHSFSSTDPCLLLKAYNVYVLPVLMYCSSVWSPRLTKDSELIEKCQRSFTHRLVRPPWAPTDYEGRLKRFNLPSLQNRRLLRDLQIAHKIIYNYICLRACDFFILSTNGKTRASSNNKLLCSKFNSNVLKGAFSHRVITPWNNLPDLVTATSSCNVFKRFITELTT